MYFLPMNFLMRNIGWVLLFLFFLFMLFIIATNNPEISRENSEVQIEQEETEETVDSIDELIERLENEASEQEFVSEDAGEDDNLSVSEEPERRWFFARLFDRDSGQTKDTDTWLPDNLLEPEEATQQSLQDSDDTEVQTPYVSHNTTTQSTPNTSLTKSLNSSYWTDTVTSPQWERAKIESDELLQDSQYTVIVHSLRLNNRYFNETLWYLMQGDIVKQVSTKNSFWCFEVEVLSSNTAYKQMWFVCEKYLQIHNSEINETEGSIQEVSLWDFPLTYIGDIIELTTPQLDINGYALFSWDTIDQMSDLDSKGCFIWKVFTVQVGGYSELLGHVQEFCAHMLYNSLDSL